MFREAFERHGFVVLLTCFLSLNRSETRPRLRGLLVLVDQPVDHLPASNPNRVSKVGKWRVL